VTFPDPSKLLICGPEIRSEMAEFLSSLLDRCLQYGSASTRSFSFYSHLCCFWRSLLFRQSIVSSPKKQMLFYDPHRGQCLGLCVTQTVFPSALAEG